MDAQKHTALIKRSLNDGRPKTHTTIIKMADAKPVVEFTKVVRL